MTKQLFEQKTQTFKLKFREQTTAAIITAFGLVIALAWKDVITQGIEQLNPFQGSNLLFSALVVTLIGVMGILITSKWFKTAT